MSPDYVWGAIAFYDRELGRRAIPPAEMNEAEYAEKYPGSYVLQCHCRWMAQRCLTVFKAEYDRLRAAANDDTVPMSDVVEFVRYADGVLGKAMRWLGYIQGVCNAVGIYSCNELRDHSRSGGREAVIEGQAERAKRWRESPLPAGARNAAHGIEAQAPLPVALRPENSILSDRDLETLATAASDQLGTGRYKREYRRVPAYPCCENVKRVERVPGDDVTLQGGICPDHGLSLPGDTRPETEDERYQRLEKEHLGDPDKKTGVYAPKQAVPQTTAIPATPPKPPGGYGASSDADWDAE